MSIQCPNCQTENLDDAKDCKSCGANLQDLQINPFHLPPGTILAEGKYKLNKTIGAGGFAITYQGINTITSEIITIKERWPAKNGSRQGKKVLWGIFGQRNYQEAIKKFKREAELLKKCTHESIVKHYDYFEENNTCYIVMPFIQGKSLYTVVEEKGVLPESKIKRYLLQLAAALKEVHAQGILHRDIKPDNIMIDATEDRAILIDFGIAREFDENETEVYTIALTHGYAPLEQYASTAKRTASADLYSLCASMYYAFTGKAPAKAVDRLDGIRNKNIDSLPIPSKIGVNISPEMEQILLTGMEMEVKKRFPRAEQLMQLLNGNSISNELIDARDLVKQNKLEAAVKKYQEFLTSNQNEFTALIELAQVLIHLDRIADAKIYAEKAHQQIPTDNNVNGILGLVYCRKSEWQEAVKYLTQATKATPQKSWIEVNYAWALAKTGNWEQSNQVLEAALKLRDAQVDSTFTFAQGLQAWIAVNQEAWKVAIPAAKQANDRAKSTNFKKTLELQNWVYPCLTIAIDKNSNSQELANCIEEFLTQLPEHPFAEGYKGLQLARQGFIQEAIPIFEKASTKNKVPRWVLLNLAILYERNQDITNAIKAYERYLKEFKDESFVLFRIGTLLGKQNQWKEAIEILEKAAFLGWNYRAEEFQHTLCTYIY